MGQCFSAGAGRHRVASPPTTPARATAQPEPTAPRAVSRSAPSPEGLSARESRASSASGDASIPPRALLRWPTGEALLGRLQANNSATLDFLPDGFDGPLEDRRGAADLAARGDVAPGPIPVLLSPVQTEAGLASVEPALLQNAPGVEARDLRTLADVAGGRPGGVDLVEGSTLSLIIEATLRFIEPNATDPAAVQRAREALEQPYTEVQLVKSGRGYHCSAHGLESQYGSAPQQALGDRLLQLDEGAHLVVRANQAVPVMADGQEAWKGHALMVSATRLPQGQVQMTIFNSHGWGYIDESLSNRDPGIGKVMPLQEACAALDSLQGGVVSLPGSMWKKSNEWNDPAIGLALAIWLGKAGSEPTLEATGRQMKPQKRDDCTVEVEFAWLAHVLPEADYKLAKAHVLNMLLHAPAPEGVEEAVLQRLRERVTSSLSAHSVAGAG
jgi:hypothetical protein